MRPFKNIKYIAIAIVIASIHFSSLHAQRFFSPSAPSSPAIEGANSTNVNQTKSYGASAPSGVTIYSASWSVTGGTILSQNSTTASIKWTTIGTGRITYNVHSSSRGRMQTMFNVSVTADAPDIPPVPSIVSETCTSTILSKTGTIPSGEMWYWQGTTKYGTDTSAPATSDYTAIESGSYKLRAKNLSTGVWSTRGSAIEVVIDTNAAGQTWYADTDGDGKGDPNDTLVQCSQPDGYVLNNDDQCPTVNGGGTFNGCEAEDPSNQNYIYTITAQVATTNIDALKLSDDAMESITYFDELGRAKQTIGIRQSPTRKDIVTHIAYDEFGRQTKEYLPYASTTNEGALQLDALSKIEDFYNTEKYQYTTNPYSEKVQESSPLGRVHEQTASGNDWLKGANRVSGKEYSDGHSIKFEYQSNAANEVRSFGVNLNTYSLTLEGNYAANTLTKTVTKDENWTLAEGVNHTTEEFKDKSGNVLLKRTYNNSQKHDTYYVYDDYGNLTYVLPPKMEGATASLSSINTELDDLGYQYKYDYRNRLIEKKIPGKGWESIVYDKLDRPVLTQDANQKLNNEWLFTKYDKLGRVVYTGIYTANTSRVSLQNTFNGKLAHQNYENKLTYGGTLGFYYSNSHFPSNNLEVLTVNYYDNYIFNMAGTISPGGIGLVYGKSLTNNVKGLATGSKVKTLGTSDWTTTVSYYDEKGQAIYVYSKNEFLKTSDIVKSKLDFTGKVLETTSYHTNTNDTSLGTQTTVDVFTYDHAGRLKNQRQYIDNSSVYANAKIVENTYDELGQLISKGVGGAAWAANPLQTVDYKYNVRGWLTNINDVSNLGNDMFAFNIKYQDIDDASKKLFNGNISQTHWKSASVNTTPNPVSKSYTYSYDALNRLKSAIDNTGNYNLNTVDYDKNGNILTLQRKGHLNTNATSFGVMDDLSYTYNNSNQLVKVADAATNDLFGFKDDAVNTLPDTANDYLYDVNGNMISDTNKGITSISYNHLNLPTTVEMGAGKIFYTYDASGVKLRKVVERIGFSTSDNTTTTDYAGNYVYENTGSGTKLQFFNHPEGYVKNDSGRFSYVYQYKDHLGNVRLSYADSNNDGEIQVETEIIEEKNYYPFGLTHKGYNNVISSNGNSVANKFGYADKELEEDLGLNTVSYGWRDYDPSIGRFNKVDRFSEKYMDKSPYHFTDNNPIAYTEIAGDSISAEFYNKKGKRLKTIPKAIQKMFNEEFGIKVGYNSKTRQLYYVEDVDSELSQSSDATKQLKYALQDDNDGFEHGIIVADYRGRDNVSGQPLVGGGGSWTSGTTTIDLSSFDSNGNLKNFNYNDVNPRSMNMARVFEHEYLGHQSRNSSRDGNDVRTGPVVDIVNGYRRQRGLDERLNYGSTLTPIFFGKTSDYSNPRAMRKAVKKMIKGQVKNNKKLTKK